MSATNEQALDDRSSQPDQKNVLYFSDGTLDVNELENEKNENVKTELPMDPKTLDWLPWIQYQSLRAGTGIVKVCDYLGESLASFFGITTPKYQFEINEYYRMKKMEEEEMKLQAELEGWSTTGNPMTVDGNPTSLKNDSEMVPSERY